MPSFNQLQILKEDHDNLMRHIKANRKHSKRLASSS
jgi:hypothetical protein